MSSRPTDQTLPSPPSPGRRSWWHRWRRRSDAAPTTLTLADLRPGQRARVADVAAGTPVGQRIMHLGLLAGAEVEVVRRAPTGDPIEVLVSGYHLSLRRSEAATVTIADTT